MQINITVDDPTSDDGTGPVTVGWFLNNVKSAIIYEAPRRVRSAELSAKHAKSASRCPAVLALEARLFEICCPIDVALGFERGEDGKALLRVLGGDKSNIRASRLGEFIHLTKEPEWRHPERPMLQLALPYTFVSDAPVYLNQLAPFLHYRDDPLPGTIFAGRFPIHVWPRPLMWAFEWHDISKPLVLRRGEPLFYAQFETVPQDRPIVLVEAEKTPELMEYLDMIAGTVNYVSQTFSMFRTAEERRPTHLLTPRKRK